MSGHGHAAAPDVNIKSQSFPRHVVVAGVAVVIAVLLHRQSTPRHGEGSDESGSPYWFLWLLLWGLVRLVQLCFGFVLLLLVILVARQRSIIYVPTPAGTQRSPANNPYDFRSPATWNLPYEDAWIFAEDGTRLHAWFVYQSPDQLTEAPHTFVYFHGNAGNIGHRLENVKDMHSRLGINILILDYRGYGNSEDGGGPCEAGFLMDAMATYRWLVERSRKEADGRQHAKLSPDRIILFGRSIGGVVAITLFAQLLEMRLRSSSDRPALPLPAGLVLENTFTSLRDMAVQVFPFLRIVSVLLRSPVIFDEWKAAERLEFLSRNYKHWCCCLLSGLQDEFIPPAQMRQIHGILKENRPKVLKFFVFQHGGHNDTPNKGGEEYWKSCQKFMDLVTETEAERIRERDALT